MLLHCNIVIAFYEKCGNYRRVKKMYIDEELTFAFRAGASTPRVGERLKNGEGELILEKKSDEHSIILIIDKQPKKEKSMEFKGIVIDVQDKSGTSKKTGEAFNACQFVVEEQADRYPQSAVFDMFGDRIPTPAVGDSVVVSFNMKASEWNGKYFGKNNVWKIEQDLIRIFKKYLWVIPLQPQPTEQHGSTASEDATTPATETGPAFLK